MHILTQIHHIHRLIKEKAPTISTSFNHRYIVSYKMLFFSIIRSLGLKVMLQFVVLQCDDLTICYHWNFMSIYFTSFYEHVKQEKENAVPEGNCEIYHLFWVERGMRWSHPTPIPFGGLQSRGHQKNNHDFLLISLNRPFRAYRLYSLTQASPTKDGAGPYGRLHDLNLGGQKRYA